MYNKRLVNKLLKKTQYETYKKIVFDIFWGLGWDLLRLVKSRIKYLSHWLCKVVSYKTMQEDTIPGSVDSVL